MQEIIERFLNYLRGIWRYRWYALAAAWTVAIAGWLMVWQMPDRYEANAKVQVDTESLLRPLLTGLAIETDVRHRLQMMARTMLSRPNLEKVARMTDLDVTANNVGEMESLLSGLEERIHLGSTREQDFYTISYANNDPEVAYRVVQALLTIFVENTLGDKRTDSDTAQRFLDQQIGEYENRLLAAEERLQEFKKKNAQYMTGSGQNYYQRLESARSQLQEARLQLEEERRRRDELKSQLEGEQPSFGLGPRREKPEGLSPLETRIQSLYNKLDELRLQYTNEHPDVEAVHEMLSLLEQQKREEEAAAVPDLPPAADQNPIYQQMRISLAQAEATVASLQVRVNEYEKRVAGLEKMVNTIPEVEAQLQRLNRDYEINKQNYDALVSRRETAKISEEAAETGDSVKFKVVEPPRVPLKPSGPDRFLFSSAVLVASLGIGLGIAFLLSQFRPVFFDRRSVRDVINYPVLGNVSLVWTQMQLAVRRKRLIAFYASLFMLMLTYGGLITFYAVDPAALSSSL